MNAAQEISIKIDQELADALARHAVFIVEMGESFKRLHEEIVKVGKYIQDLEDALNHSDEETKKANKEVVKELKAVEKANAKDA